LLIASLSRLTYNDTNLTNGQTYYYAVSAVNSAGESLLTEEVAVTPNAPSNDNTLLYVGIGAVAILGVVGAAILMMRRRK
jgi:hypothetical protein